MPFVNTTLIVDDEIPTAAELNAPYDDLATASAAIDSDNIASGAIRHQHIYFNPSSLYIFEDDNSTNITDINSTSYVTLTRGAQPTEIDLPGAGLALERYQPVRISGTCLVTNNNFTKTWDFVGTDLGKANLYAFRILLSISTSGGPTTTVTLGEWGYSFGTASSTDRNSTLTGGLSSTSIALCFQTAQFEGIYRPSTTGVVLEKIELQAKVFDLANTLRISRNALHAIVAER